jgi:hypothetical protein
MQGRLRSSRLGDKGSGRFSAIAQELLMPLSRRSSHQARIRTAFGAPIMKDISSPRALILNGWRIAGWGSLLALLLLPALAMRLTAEVNWTGSDFVFAAILLGLVGTAVEMAVRFARNRSALSGYLIACFGAFFTFWVNAAVGIIGDDNFVNRFFFLMVFAGILGGLVFGFRARAMRWIAAALAIGQYAVGIAALFLMPGHAVEWGLLTGLAMLWLVAAACFHRAMAARVA